MFNRFALIHIIILDKGGLKEAKIKGFWSKKKAIRTIEKKSKKIIGKAGENLYYTSLINIDNGKEIIVSDTKHILQIKKI